MIERCCISIINIKGSNSYLFYIIIPAMAIYTYYELPMYINDHTFINSKYMIVIMIVIIILMNYSSYMNNECQLFDIKII